MKESNTLVAKAAQILDRLYPGWHRRVKLTTLDMSDSCNCITAQLGLNTWEREELPKTVLAATLWRDSGMRTRENVEGPWRREVRARRARKVAS